MVYQPNDSYLNDTWLIFRLNSHVKHQPVDIYWLFDLSNEIILAIDIVEDQLSQSQANTLLKEAKLKSGQYPQSLILTHGDPAEGVLAHAAKKLNIFFATAPAADFEDWIAPIKTEFGKAIFSPSSIGYVHVKEGTDELDKESLKRMLPDSYDPCPCPSGEKYKFCCKRILPEIMEAMVAAQEGDYKQALQWLKKAKKIVGETAEVLCREAIIYSYFDMQKSDKVFKRCLSINPNHPRAHYIRGLSLRKQGDFHGAIAHYPETDHYHLYETYNNLGSVYCALGHLDKAKAAWEKAVFFLPSDKIARENLLYCLND